MKIRFSDELVCHKGKVDSLTRRLLALTFTKQIIKAKPVNVTWHGLWKSRQIKSHVIGIQIQASVFVTECIITLQQLN